MGKIKRRNHWIPRFYLSYFSIPEKRETDSPSIWALSNKEGNPIQVSISNIAHNRYLYSPENSKHLRSQEFEDFLGEFESKMAIIWQTFAKADINFREKNICSLLSYFIVTMYLRNIQQLDEIRRIKVKIVESIDTLPKDDLGNPLLISMIINGTEIMIDPSTFSDYKNPNYDKDHEMFVETIKEDTYEFANDLLKKKWTILKSESNSFITTDNPVTICKDGNIANGLLRKDNKVIFPISPKYLLIIHEDQKMLDGRYYTTNHPEWFNYLLWRNAYRFMLSPRNTDLVLQEMNWILNKLERGK